MQMIERVARRIAQREISSWTDTERGFQPINLLVDQTWRDWQEVAKDVFEEMLTPTDAMIEAGGTANYGHTRETAVEWAKEDKWDSHAHEAAFLYKAMITAALQEGMETQG